MPGDEDDFDKLKELMFKYGMSAYVEQQQLLMEKAIEWNKEWAEEEIDQLYKVDQIKHKRDRANKEITAALKSITLYPELATFE